ncbi:MAG: ImmA/IrrE family metallo-endopeptidase [Gammaproteobacteria bacterium]|nr:ImmA/IrrE family metallo-endopeptidase [Gammaproteobacteria bacterium]
MPNINHTILSWARETAEISLENAAPKLQIKDGKETSAVSKLTAYENGTTSPSRSMLIRMSKLYHRPLLTFYLDNPPSIGDRGEDFRTLPDHYERAENAYVDVLIRNIKARQSLIRETLIDEDEEIKLSFVGRNSIDQDVQHITQTLREVIKLDIEEFRECPTYGDAFKLLRDRVEEAGVFVLLQGNLGSYHTDISVTTFRGFALSDDVAPFILINNRDAKSAWSFTLLHEMAHLALGQTGVSGAYAEKRVEKLCNEVASEFLLPSEEFKRFNLLSFDAETIREEISQYALSKKISSSHITYRLYRRGDISKGVWSELSDYFHQQWKNKQDKDKEKLKQRSGGPNYYVVRRYNLGALVGLIRRLTYSGALSTTKAGMLLDVRPLKVHRLFEINHSA